jgi:hypothetical protein
MKTNYSQSEIRTFRKKDLRSLIQTLIKADADRNQGSGKKLNREQIVDDLKWVLGIEEKMVDYQNKVESDSLNEKIEEATKTPPF